MQWGVQLRCKTVVLLSQQQELATFAPAIAEYVRAHYLWNRDVGGLAIYVRF